MRAPRCSTFPRFARNRLGAGVACLFAVDFITGVIHWAEDTWTALGRSKLLDAYVVRDNIEHHRKPGGIRAGTYWETNRVCIALASAIACALVLFGVHAWEAYAIVLLASQSNQVHKWAHCANPPRAIRTLQRSASCNRRRTTPNTTSGRTRAGFARPRIS